MVRRLWMVVGLTLTAAVMIARVGTRSAAAEREQQARQLLDRMRAAERDLEYAATARAEFWYGEEKKTSRVTIRHQRGGRRLLQFDDGSASGSDGECEWIYDAKSNRALWCPPGSSEKFWQGDGGLLFRNYIVSRGREERVANRKGVALEVQPRRARRSRVRLIVDDETGIPLAQEQFDAGGHTQSRTVLTQLDLRGGANAGSFVPPVMPRAGKSETQAMPPGDLNRELGFAPARPALMPAGFTIAGAAALYRCGCCSKCELRAAMLTLTDGLEQLTVFQSRPPTKGCQADRDDAKCELDRFGQGAVVHLAKDTTRITVVGSLPEAELRRVAQSVRTK